MSNLIDHAKEEFKLLGWPGDCEMQQMVCDNVLELMEVFSKQGHSGSSAPYIIDLFKKLAMFKIIAPLTGEDDEWCDVSDMCDGNETYQNKRCSAVFKDGKNGKAYWIDGKIFRDPDGCCYTSRDSRVDIEFPWRQCEPEYVEVDDERVD